MIERKKVGWASDPNSWSGTYVVPTGFDKERIKRILSGKS